MERNVSEEHLAKKIMKMFNILRITETQIRATLRSPLNTVRRTIIKKITSNKPKQDCGERKLLICY